MSDIGITNPLVGSELDAAIFDIGGAVPEKVTLRVGAGLTRTPDGLVIDQDFVLALIGDTGNSGADIHVTAHGFDPATEILTLNMSNGDQVPGQLVGVVTEAKLETRLSTGSAELRSVFGTVIGRVLTQ